MGKQAIRESYVTACAVAQSQLEQIFHDYEQLKTRKEQLEQVVGALQPFLRTSPQTFASETRQTGSREEAVKEREAAKPVSRAVLASVPVTSSVFSSTSADLLDPLQSRINRALGLAVA
jgi:cell division septum initiation protein DivIVA